MLTSSILLIFCPSSCNETFKTHKALPAFTKITHNYEKCGANITERHPISVKGHHSLGPQDRNTLAFPHSRTQLMLIAFKSCPPCFWTVSSTCRTVHAPPWRAFEHIPGLVKSQMPQDDTGARLTYCITPTVCSLQRRPGISYMWGISWSLQVQEVTFYPQICCNHCVFVCV